MRPEETEQLEGEVEGAHEVKKLKSKFLDAFFEAKQEQLFDMFLQIPLGSTDDLNNVHHQLKSLNALQAEVETVINTGKLAGMSLSAELDKTNN